MKEKQTLKLEKLIYDVIGEARTTKALTQFKKQLEGKKRNHFRNRN